jgi:hypothetical protein
MGVSHPTEPKGKGQAGVCALLIFATQPLLDSVVATDGNP